MDRKSKLKKSSKVKQSFIPTNFRKHEAALGDPLVADWIVSPLKDYNKQVRAELEILRNRSRDLEENNDIVRKFLFLMESNVAGANGFTLLLPSELENVKNAYIEWSKTAEISERFSYEELTRYVVRSTSRDGEIFIQYVRDAKSKDGLKLYIVESDKVDVNYNDENKKVINGVEVDNYGREVAYYVKTVGGKLERISSQDMIRIGKTERAGATRSFPYLCSSMRNLKMLAGYTEATVVKERLAASASIYITRIPGSTDMMPDGYDNTGAPLMDILPGTISRLEPGSDIKTFTPASSGGFAEFNDAMLTQISGGLGISAMALSGNMSKSNYASARLAALEERDFYKMQQNYFIKAFASKVFLEWLRMASVSGTITTAEAEVASKAFSYSAKTWTWIDPQTELATIEKELELKLKSRSMILAERGEQIENVLTKIKEDTDKEAEINAAPVVEPESVKPDYAGLVDLALSASSKDIPVETAKALAFATYPELEPSVIEAVFAPIATAIALESPVEPPVETPVEAPVAAPVEAAEAVEPPVEPTRELEPIEDEPEEESSEDVVEEAPVEETEEEPAPEMLEGIAVEEPVEAPVDDTEEAPVEAPVEDTEEQSEASEESDVSDPMVEVIEDSEDDVNDPSSSDEIIESD